MIDYFIVNSYKDPHLTYYIKIFFAVCCVAVALPTTQASAQNVDVYFIAGQSNAGNLGEINSYDVQGYNGYNAADFNEQVEACLLYTSPSPRDKRQSRMPSSA